MKSSITRMRECPPGDAIMGADRNHPALVRGFLIQPVELGFELAGEIAARAPAILEILKIVKLERVGHHHKRLALHGDHERLIAAQIVGVIQKPRSCRMPNVSGVARMPGALNPMGRAPVARSMA